MAASTAEMAIYPDVSCVRYIARREDMRATRVAWRADLFELLCRVLHATARACCTGSSSLAALSATHTTPSTAARLLAVRCCGTRTHGLARSSRVHVLNRPLTIHP
ncbi:MAG: hypothetical protein ACPIOQ_57155, partial [Promethearchaeia archaeon]